jgi:LuxR family transcriptional regulator, maltose regulon positive regulatory protein
VDDLIHTKVAPPAWLANNVRRESLLARLDGALTKRLTIVHAPAGYGKTSLLSQWRDTLRARGIRVAWLTLEGEDSDAAQIARYLGLALDPDHVGSPVDLPPRAALSAIISRLGREEEPIVLILDDHDRADDPAVLDFFVALIRLAPANCHVVAASRDYPRLGQSALVAADQVLEITTRDLKFSSVEAGALLRPQIELDDRGLDQIMDRTEGWPIALQLTALSIRRGVDRDTLAQHVGGPGVELARYLSEQVFTALPPATQDVLLRTAVLDRVTGEAINHLCDRLDGWLVIEQLEQQGVVLTPLDAGRIAFRYHQLFTSYLRDRLARHDRAAFRAVHRRAARFFTARGEVTEAVGHAIQAEDEALLADVVEHAGAWRLIPQGLQAVVERALSALPAHTIDQRWRLRLARIYLRIKHGEMAAARADYDALTSANVLVELSVDARIEVRVVGDTLADYENVPMTLDDLIEREALLRTLPADDHLVLASVTEALGAKYLEGGWLERAMEPTLAARGHYRALGLIYSELFTHFQEARIRRAQGRISDAARILAETRAWIETHFGAQSDLAANCAAFQAELLFEQGRDADALRLLDWALPHMEQSDGWVDVYQAAYATAARATAAAGDLQAAIAILARARALAVRRRFPQLEHLARLHEAGLMIDYAGHFKQASALAETSDVDGWAAAMATESPQYRPVAVAATLLRAKLRLLDGDVASANEDLVLLRRWAGQHGAGRLLVDVNLLVADVAERMGDAELTQQRFDEAVGAAMFHDLSRPFIELHSFTREKLNHAVNRGENGDDRFRVGFLRAVLRGLSARPDQRIVPNALSDGEAAILAHLRRGLSNKEIARHIGMSPDTVKYRLKSIFRKVGVDNRRDAVRVSQERGLTPNHAG